MNTGTETCFNVHKQIPVNDQIVQNPTTPHQIRRPTHVLDNMCNATCARQHVLDNMCDAICALQLVLGNMC